MCTEAESVPLDNAPFTNPRISAFEDLDPRPAAMCLPQVINAMALLPCIRLRLPTHIAHLSRLSCSLRPEENSSC